MTTKTIETDGDRIEEDAPAPDNSTARWICKGDVCGECSTRHRSYRSSEDHCIAINRRIRSEPGGQNSYSDQTPRPLNAAAERQLRAALAQVHRTGEDYRANFDFAELVDSR